MSLTSEHHEVITLHFAERRPEIIANRFIVLCAMKENNSRVQTLVNNFNYLGFVNLSILEYKRVNEITMKPFKNIVCLYANKI